jgi:sortase A
MNVRRFLERILLLAGLAGLGIFAGSIVRTAVWQSWDNWAFSSALHGGTVSVANYVNDMTHNLERWLTEWRGRHPEPAPAPRDAASLPAGVLRARPYEKSLIGRLNIPRLHLVATVREGVEDKTLGLALGHIPNTALPGERGNVGVAGHRDTFFRSLGNVRKNDLIRFETFAGTYTYQVGSIEIVEPKDVEVLQPGKHSELTLVTCYPFNYIGSAPERFIVKADLVGAGAATGSIIPAKAESRQNVRAVGARLGERKIAFTVPLDHSRSLAPGISLGITGIDPITHTANGWMWLMPDRRTIWLKQRRAGEQVVFYGYQDGKRREVSITSIGRDRVTGYVRISN